MAGFLEVPRETGRSRPGNRGEAVAAGRACSHRGAGHTDAGRLQLEKLTSLGDVYLRQTQVTHEGVKRLKRALPKADISH